DAEFVVFGVVTEFCVRCAAKGLLERDRKVSVVTDAIETLNADDSRHTLNELQSLGARLINTQGALAMFSDASPARDSAVSSSGGSSR
ncbi:MAG: isochorismatase family protein, partial [Terracidiphilus sp.]